MSQDDTAVKDEAVTQEPATDSAPEQNSPEVAETNSAQREDGELVVQETEDEESSNADDTADESKSDETDGQPQDGEQGLTPKAQNRVQQAINERNQYKTENEQLRQRLQELEARRAQFAAEQELANEINPETGDYYTPQEIERIAWQQSREQQYQQTEQELYQTQVLQNQQTIAGEAERAIQEFPMFDETSPDYNPQLAQQADALLAQSLITDGNGSIIGANISPYQLYKTIYNSSQANSARQQAQAQKNTERMLANVDNPGGSQQGEKSFEKLSVDEMAAKLRSKGYDI